MIFLHKIYSKFCSISSSIKLLLISEKEKIIIEYPQINVLISGVFVGPMSEMLSHRLTTSIGIFLMGSGTILSSFAKSSVDIFLSVGLISGM